MPTYSEQICTRFDGCKFSDEFKNDIDEFFENSKNLTHLQYLAVSSKLNDKSILNKFRTQIDEIWDNSRNLLTNFMINSIKDIADFMKDENLNFQNLKFASGETHNRKKSVLMANINDRKFVYKPYSCSYLRVLNAVFDTLKPNLKYDLEVFPKILTQNENFTIVEFLKAQNEIKTQKAYYAIGVVLGFATVFRITDLHSENILFNDDNLYILDSESCFFRDNSNQNFEPKFTHLINDGFYDKTNLEYKLHLSENKVGFLQKRNFKNPSLNLYKNLRHIKVGFSDIIRAITEKSKILNEIILSMNFYTRVILRPTNAYAIWLSELFKPSVDLEINIKNLSIAMSKFCGINCAVKNIGEIIKAELLDMILTDIPFFYICKNSLYHNENLIMENLYKEPYEKFIKGLFLNLNNIKFDDNIVKKS